MHDQYLKDGHNSSALMVMKYDIILVVRNGWDVDVYTASKAAAKRRARNALATHFCRVNRASNLVFYTVTVTNTLSQNGQF